MRMWLCFGLVFLVSCGGEITDDEQAMLDRIATGTDFDTDQLLDIMTMCQAAMDCYENDCADDADVRKHMSRAPVTDWGMSMVMEFKSKGIRPMASALADFLETERLDRPQWPCKEFSREHKRQKRKNRR